MNFLPPAVPLGLAAAASWGVADFAGGLATRRAPPSRVVFIAHGVSLVLLAALAGLLDTGGNGLYMLASLGGRLDVAAVLSSLYPGATIVLAAVFLHERATRLQALGMALALAAVGLIAA